MSPIPPCAGTNACGVRGVFCSVSKSLYSISSLDMSQYLCFQTGYVHVNFPFVSQEQTWHECELFPLMRIVDVVQITCPSGHFSLDPIENRDFLITINLIAPSNLSLECAGNVRNEGWKWMRSTFASLPLPRTYINILCF